MIDPALGNAKFTSSRAMWVYVTLTLWPDPSDCVIFPSNRFSSSVKS